MKMMTSEETMIDEETPFAAGDGDEERADVPDGQSNQPVDTQQLTYMSHEESTCFVIKSVIDPRTGQEICMDQVSTRSFSLTLLLTASVNCNKYTDVCTKLRATFDVRLTHL